MLHGHGLRSRQQRGPRLPGLAPQIVEVQARRYRCRRCRAVTTVMPRGVLAGMLYSAAAIAWALALYGSVRLSSAEVRRRTSPWQHIGWEASERWATLRRWARQVRGARLFTGGRRSPPDWTLRQFAEAAAARLAAHAPAAVSMAPLCHRAFFGAERAA
jgi:hypothetical protein